MRYGMVIDLKRCIGCYACEVACRAEKGTPPGITFSRVAKMEWGTYPSVKRMSLPLLCMQCQDSPCSEVCPTGATKLDPDGVVRIDPELCIGCRYCMMACPYAARYYFEPIGTADGSGTYFPGHVTPYEQWSATRYTQGTVVKCDFCTERVRRGQEPACVANCITKARIFGDLDNPDTLVARYVRAGAAPLNPEMGTNPSVFYSPP